MVEELRPFYRLLFTYKSGKDARTEINMCSIPKLAIIRDFVAVQMYRNIRIKLKPAHLRSGTTNNNHRSQLGEPKEEDVNKLVHQHQAGEPIC